MEIKSPDFLQERKSSATNFIRDGIQLSEEIIDFLASEVKSNVRELIGVINSVIAHSMIYKSDLTLDLLKETINKIATNKDKTISISPPMPKSLLSPHSAGYHLDEVCC